MKALTIWQPWASLIAAGVKQYETCFWSTAYRGELAIHAAKRWGKEQKKFASDMVSINYHKEFDGLFSNGSWYQFGKVLCVVKLVDVIEITQEWTLPFTLTSLERSVGDFSAGRYAWKLEIVEVFDVPIPARGRQGLWEWTFPSE